MDSMVCITNKIQFHLKKLLFFQQGVSVITITNGNTKKN